LPDGLKTLCDSAFESCELLQEINLPDGLETIGSDAFWWCSSLENIEIPESVTSVGSSAFLATALINRLEDESEDGNSYISNWLIVSFSRGSETVIAPGTVGISGSAFSFEGKEDYTDIILPDGLKYIGNDAFWYCSNLQSIKIPDSVETVGTEAFGGCAKLTDVTVPAEAEIADNAFSELSQDACVFVKARVNGYGDIFGKSKVYAVQCGDSAFWEIDGDTLHIYGTGLLDDYADTSQMPWNDFIPQIKRVVIDSGIIVPNGKIFGGLSLEEDIIQDGKLVRKSGGVEITVDPSIESIGAYAFGSDVTSALIGDGVKEIDPNAFDDVSSLTVKGYSDSAAYAFTQANPTVTFVEFKVVKGCVTGSNGADESKKPTMQDAMLLFNGVMSGDTTHFFCNAAADFNSDSVVSLVDVLGVLLAMSET